MADETQPGWAEKVARMLQELYLSGVHGLPEPIKRPLRHAVGRVATNVITPIDYATGDEGDINKAQEIASLFAPAKLGHTLASIARDEPAYSTEESSPFGAAATRAGRALFREYFDLPTQDTEKMFLADGKNIRLNPETTNQAVAETLENFNEPDRTRMHRYSYLTGDYLPGHPDPWNFDLRPSELERVKGRVLPLEYFGRQYLEALGHPAILQTGYNPEPLPEEPVLPATQYQSGGIVPQFGGTNMNGISMSTQPARRRIGRQDMRGSGMGRPRNTFPVPSGRPIDRITMGPPGPPMLRPPLPPSDFGPFSPPGGGFSTAPAYGPAPGPTDTVPAMLTPGEGVLNTGAMRMVGEPAVNALNRYGRGIAMQGGGVVREKEEDDRNPTFEESKNWTQADWDAWRKRHPRFEPSPTPTPEHHGGGGVAGRGDFSGYDLNNPLNETPYGYGGAPNIGLYGGTDNNPHYWYDPLFQGGTGRGGLAPGGFRGGPWGHSGFNPTGRGGGGGEHAGLGSPGGFGGGGPQSGGAGGGPRVDQGQVDYGDITATFVPGFNWKPWKDVGNLPARTGQGMAMGGIVPGYAEGTGSVEISGGGPHSSWGTGKPTRDLIGTGIGAISNLLLPGLGFATSPLARYVTSLVQRGKWGSFAPNIPNAKPQGGTPAGAAPPPVAAPQAGYGEGSGGGQRGFEGLGGTAFEPLSGAGVGVPGYGGSLGPSSGYTGGQLGYSTSQGWNWKPWKDVGRLPTHPSQGVATGGVITMQGVVPSFQEGGTVKPIGYTDPIEEAEWQKLVQFLPPNTDIAKLREQAKSSGISPQAMAGIAQMFSSFGSGTSGYSPTGYNDLAAGGGA